MHNLTPSSPPSFSPSLPPYLANLAPPRRQPVQTEEVLRAQGRAAHHFSHRLKKRRSTERLDVSVNQLPHSLHVLGIHGAPGSKRLELRDQVDHLVLRWGGGKEGREGREGVGEDATHKYT